MQTRQAIRAVAAFEAFKGLLALAGASGLLLLLHKDLHDLAIRLVEHAHLNPAAHYPSIFITAAQQLNGKLLLIALGAAAYSSLRFAEAYGLYREAAWAEVLAAASGAIYLPFEVLELLHHPNSISIGSFVLNLLVVVLMLAALWQRRQTARPTGHHTR
ncbi:DUF2127 domain-containing protein [Vogesella oryzae]|uniref:DUF2127 domain-containing protein n=1 Tax=Vogesella oryzae TaxID=1735285 RepID=UPI0015840E25|nr:DUF2127 domain-containing protein [Vogesella oryzae]